MQNSDSHTIIYNNMAMSAKEIFNSEDLVIANLVVYKLANTKVKKLFEQC